MSPANSQRSHRTEKSPGLANFAWISIAIISLSGLCALAIFNAFPDWEERASFGNMFGPISTLLSGLGLAGVIVTIFLQREDLRLQRQELEDTRKELARAAAAQELSQAALEGQLRTAQDSARLSALGILIPILQKRLEGAPDSVRSSTEYGRIVDRLDLLEDELDHLIMSPSGPSQKVDGQPEKG